MLMIIYVPQSSNVWDRMVVSCTMYVNEIAELNVLEAYLTMSPSTALAPYSSSRVPVFRHYIHPITSMQH